MFVRDFGSGSGVEMILLFWFSNFVPETRRNEWLYSLLSHHTLKEINLAIVSNGCDFFSGKSSPRLLITCN